MFCCLLSVPIRIKSEPPSSPTSNGNETFDDHISHPIQKDLKFDAVSSSEPGISDSANEIESDTAGTVNNVPAESSRVALVNLIHDMVRTHPIIGFTEVVKRIQESTLNYCPREFFFISPDFMNGCTISRMVYNLAEP